MVRDPSHVYVTEGLPAAWSPGYARVVATHLDNDRVVQTPNEHGDRQPAPRSSWLARWRVAYGREPWGRVRWWVLLATVITLLAGSAVAWLVPAQVERALLEARAERFRGLVSDIAAGIPTVDLREPETLASLAREIPVHVLGPDVVRVKVWSSNGTVVFGDGEFSSGFEQDLPQPVQRALRGEETIVVPDPNVDSTDVGLVDPGLIEFHIPAVLPGVGNVDVEMYVDTASVAMTVARIRRTVSWLVGMAAVLTGGATIGLLIVGGRVLEARRREAEELLAQALRARVAERRRIAAQLHDVIGQRLYRSIHGLEAWIDNPRARPGEPGKVLGQLRDVEAVIRAELRSMVDAGLEARDLGAILADLIQEIRTDSDLVVTCRVDEGVEPDGERAEVLALAIREAAMNVVKHAGARHLAITVEALPSRILVTVVDDGVGIGRTRGIGLSTVRQRLKDAGGDLDVNRAPNGGTIFRAWVPAGGG